MCHDSMQWGEWNRRPCRSTIGLLKRTRAIQSAFATLAYLVATLVPCGIPRLEAGHAMPASGGAVHARADKTVASERSEATHADHDHGQAHAHGAHAHGAHDHGAPAPAAPQVHPAEHADPPEAALASSSGSPDSALSFKAPCVCGCSDTRANVGGGAARLGVAVPPSEVARWCVDLASPSTPAKPVAISAVFLARDPLPT